MAYNLLYKASVKKDLGRLSKAEARRVLNRIEHVLAEKPNAYPMLKGKYAGLRKLRIGEYRVIFVILDKDVLVLRIGHRKDVYSKE